MQNTDCTSGAFDPGTWKRAFRLGRAAENARDFYVSERATMRTKLVCAIVDMFVVEWKAAVELVLSLPWSDDAEA